MLFRKSSGIDRQNIISAINSVPDMSEVPAELLGDEFAGSILNDLESGKSDFWSAIHLPFKNNEMTRDTVKTIINEAKRRYHTNLPELAIKLKVCDRGFQKIPQEKQKFVSFKNFLYKTVRYTEN